MPTVTPGSSKLLFSTVMTMTNAPEPTRALLRVYQIIGCRKRGIPAILPISRSSWWAGVKSGKYPRPIKLGPKTIAWRASDIQALLTKLEGDNATL